MPLLRAGVRIYEYTPGFLHAKCCVSDDRAAVVGSINLDYRSLFLHFECGVLLLGGSQVRELREDMLRTVSASHRVQLADCRHQRAGHPAGQCAAAAQPIDVKDSPFHATNPLLRGILTIVCQCKGKGA